MGPELDQARGLQQLGSQGSQGMGLNIQPTAYTTGEGWPIDSKLAWDHLMNYFLESNPGLWEGEEGPIEFNAGQMARIF